jgi:uncharacterized protein (TIGR03382 family)
MAGLLLTVATTARAGWTVKPVQGTPNDVEVWDATRFSVSTSTGAWLYSTDGGTLASLSAGGSMPVGTYLTSQGCFLAFRTDNIVPSTCGALPGPYTGTASVDIVKVKATETGAAYAMSSELAQRNTFVSFKPPGNFDAGNWVQGPEIISESSMNVAALSQGGLEHALVAVGHLRNVELYWFTNGTRASPFILPDAGLPPRPVQTIDLFPAGGTTPTALFGWDNKLYRGPLVGTGGFPFQEVSLPGGPGSVTALDVNTGPGAQHGDGFGMATLQRDGGVVTLMRAVPEGQPQQVGTRWQASALPAGLPPLVSPRSVDCRGARLCVIGQAVPNTGNVFVYTNDAPPQIRVESQLPSPFSVPEGTTRTINLRASDPDGDPVRMTVTPSSVSQAGYTMTTTEVDGGVDLLVNAGTNCVTRTQPLTIAATDGLDEHRVTQDYVLQVEHTVRPDAPSVTPPTGTRAVQAGGDALRLTAQASSPTSCTIVEYRWTRLSSGAPALTLSEPDTSVAAFLPPRTVCNAQGETHLYRVEAIDEGNLASLPTDFNIQVLPWGPPNAPFRPDERVTVFAGDGGLQWLSPNTPTHACERPDTGFPGVETVWQISDGGLPPAGVRLLAEDGTRITGSSAVTPRLGIEADECTDVQFSIDVQNYTRGSAGPGSTVAPVVVRVDKNWNPISEGQVELSTTLATAESVAGIAGVKGIRCFEQRRGLELQARLALKRDGTVVREEIFPVPGPWGFRLSDACLGTTYQLEGELLSGSGSGGQARPGGAQGLGTEGSSVLVTESITVPPVEQAKLEPIEAAHLTARCGQPATGTLEQRPLAPCSELPVSWAQLGGPELTQATFTGSRFEVATQEADFGALIGQKVRMRMSTRTVQETTLEQEIPITVEPFVELQRRTERGAGTDTGLVGVSVELRNTTECGVSQVEHWERLEGVDYQLGSARFNDAPVEAELEGDLLKVRGLVLEGGATGRLTYVVRPRLLESARFGGQSFLREVSLSRPLEDPPAAGCGCSGGGSGLAALGLAGLAAALRRRRSQ